MQWYSCDGRLKRASSCTTRWVDVAAGDNATRQETPGCFGALLCLSPA